jgi:hypothetical protein
MNWFQFFDPHQEVALVGKHLPHWAQSGTMCFVTWRTADSLPESAHERIAQELSQYLKSLGLNPTGDWRQEMAKLPPTDRSRAHWFQFTAWDRQLDLGVGELVLSRPEISALVAESLLAFDEDRYFITDFAVMPNHVHVLVAFPSESAMFAQYTSWKRFTGRKINAMMGRAGPFWQTEHFNRYREYIANNPRAANLRDSQFRLFSKSLTNLKSE